MNFLVQEWKQLKWRRWVILSSMLTLPAWARMHGELFVYAVLTCIVVLTAVYLTLRFYMARGYTLAEIAVYILQVYSWPFHGGYSPASDGGVGGSDQVAAANTGHCAIDAAADRLHQFVLASEPDAHDDELKIWSQDDYCLVVRSIGDQGDYDCMAVVRSGFDDAFGLAAVRTMHICHLRTGVLLRARTDIDCVDLTTLSWEVLSSIGRLPSRQKCRRLPQAYDPERDTYAYVLERCLDKVSQGKRTR